MKSDVLKVALKTWMQQETWHTNHPCDVKRFNKALQDAVSKLGVNIDGYYLEEVITVLAEECSPNMEESYT